MMTSRHTRLPDYTLITPSKPDFGLLAAEDFFFFLFFPSPLATLGEGGDGWGWGGYAGWGGDGVLHPYTPLQADFGLLAAEDFFFFLLSMADP